MTRMIHFILTLLIGALVMHAAEAYRSSGGKDSYGGYNGNGNSRSINLGKNDRDSKTVNDVNQSEDNKDHASVANRQNYDKTLRRANKYIRGQAVPPGTPVQKITEGRPGYAEHSFHRFSADDDGLGGAFMGGHN